MWIVQQALVRPHTFLVLALFILIGGSATISRMPTDIFPEIDIPVVTVVWTYTGLTAREMETRLTTYSEFGISATVGEVKAIESQTLEGVAVIRVHFHPGVKIEAAVAQVTATSQAILRRMPPGVLPPTILRFSASSVPVLQLALSSRTLTEDQLYDHGIYRIRQQLAVVQGITLPAPYGGKARQVMIDVDPQALLAHGLTAAEVSAAINTQNLTLPTGRVRIGSREYGLALNSSPDMIASLGEIPVKVVQGRTLLVRDVAQVRDGFAIQSNIVRQDGRRGVLLTLLKSGRASTIEVVRRVKDLLPAMRASAPEGMEISLLFDQSLFVEAAVHGVVEEGLIAGGLTALLILVFLGSWRSTLIVVTSIPLSILAALVLLGARGDSLNVMTLGGLALAIGILVDDATVEIENVHRHRKMGKPLRQAILDGAQQIAGPTFIATSTISIVFVSVTFLEGPPRHLFVPMALAVVLALQASYLLSRTLVPTLVQGLLANEEEPGGLLGRIHHAFDRRFEAMRARYVALLSFVIDRPRIVLGAFAVVIGTAVALAPRVGRDFFPEVDAGQFRLQVRAPAGTRLEETERLFEAVEEEIRNVIPITELSQILDNIGLPSETFNLAFGDSTVLSSAEGEILVSLVRGHPTPTRDHVARLRKILPAKFPQVAFFFRPADIAGQILNFGLPAPIDVRVSGYDQAGNLQIAREIDERLREIPGVVDVHLHQIVDAPQLYLEVDRTRAAEAGLNQRDVANNVLVAVSSSTQVTPNYWADPRTGLPYLVAVQSPPRTLDSFDALTGLPLGSVDGHNRIVADFATLSTRTAVAAVTHSNVQPAFDVLASVEGRDLGSVAQDIQRLLSEFTSRLKPGNRLALRGQVESMETSFSRLGAGILFAALLVYLLMVVNFQSWRDPLVILAVLPAALSGIVFALLGTGTTLSIPSLMGTLMTVGVGTANAILLLTFARERMEEGIDRRTALIEAGGTRLRPILMTATAMIVGMLPMAIGLGEGSEQNSPLGRAVIGGLLAATVGTLLLLPVLDRVIPGGTESASDDISAAEISAPPSPGI